jgi:hypothetical protein
MFIQPIDYVLLILFVLAAGSTLYVAIDQFRNHPEPTVMRWGFILVTLYMGRLGFCSMFSPIIKRAETRHT